MISQLRSRGVSSNVSSVATANRHINGNETTELSFVKALQEAPEESSATSSGVRNSSAYLDQSGRSDSLKVSTSQIIEESVMMPQIIDDSQYITNRIEREDGRQSLVSRETYRLSACAGKMSEVSAT